VVANCGLMMGFKFSVSESSLSWVTLGIEEEEVVQR